MSSTKFRDKLEIKSYSGTDISYRILVRVALDIGPGGTYEPGNVNGINIFNAGKQDIGDFFVDNVQQVIDNADPTNTYTMLIGRLASGGKIAAADDDLGDAVSYKLAKDRGDETLNHFVISDEGEISTSNSAYLDFEERNMYEVWVIAEDKSGYKRS